MRSVTVPVWGDIFCGKFQTTSTARPYRAKPDDYQRWLGYLGMSVTASTVLAATESAMEFFKIEKDLALIVPKEEWSEFFFSLKNGFVAPNCPAQFIYFAKAIYAQHRICNLIGPMLPKETSYYTARDGYFGAGYTARDAICNFVNPHFQPITPEHWVVRCGDWYEAYIPSTDMVVALPPSIGQVITQEDLAKVIVTPGIGLTLGGRPLASFGGNEGVVNSVYDLRGVV